MNVTPHLHSLYVQRTFSYVLDSNKLWLMDQFYTPHYCARDISHKVYNLRLLKMHIITVNLGHTLNYAYISAYT